MLSTLPTNIHSFFNQLKKSQTDELKLSPYIFYHNDADGICSATLMVAYLEEELGIHNVRLQTLSVDEIQSIVVFSPSIFLDLPVLPQHIENNQKQPILIIDHHVIPEEIKKDELITYLNPRENDPSVYKPASFVVYSLLEESEVVKKRAFVAAAGIIGDKGDENDEDCKIFVEKFDYHLISKLSDIITAVFAVNKTKLDFNATMSDLIKFLLEQNSVEDFLAKPSKFLEQAVEFQKNLEETICQAKIEKLNNVALLIQIDSTLCSPSIISTILLDKYSDYTIFVINKSPFKNQNSKQHIKISCRSKLIDCNLLMREIASQIPDSNGGGHERAAGLLIPTKYFQKFVNFVKSKT